MIDREMIVKGLEVHTNLRTDCEDCPYNGQLFCQYKLIEDALKLLKEQEQVTESTSWICHLYRTGNKRFECKHCHRTSWRNSPYCPDCGTKMEGWVIMDD